MKSIIFCLLLTYLSIRVIRMISSILNAVIDEENIFLEDKKMEMIHPTHDPRHMQVVVLDGDDFTIEEVVAVARYHAKVEFAPEFIERLITAYMHNEEYPSVSQYIFYRQTCLAAYYAL